MHAWLLCSAFKFVPGNEDNTSCNTDMDMYCMGEVGPFLNMTNWTITNSMHKPIDDKCASV